MAFSCAETGISGGFTKPGKQSLGKKTKTPVFFPDKKTLCSPCR